MAKKRSRARNHSRLSNRKHSNDVSTSTLAVMVLLVFVVSLLSVGMYVHALSTYKVPNSVSNVKIVKIIKEQGPASGMATLQIIKLPENSKK